MPFRRPPACFNPHPAFGPGATSAGVLHLTHTKAVSILTRPSGRVLLHLHGGSTRADCGFNPHPAFGPGATQLPPIVVWRQYWFQSSPGLRAGCYRAMRNGRRCRCRFQSSPGLRAGCYLRAVQGTDDDPNRFNPHPAFGPGATFARRLAPRRALFQSSPGLRAGCYRPR